MRTSAAFACSISLSILAVPASAGINRWTSIGPERGVACKVAAAPSRPRTLYAGLYAGGVFRSLDRGATWAPARNGLPFSELNCSLVIDPNTPNTAYVSTERDGVFKTTDGGASWTPVNNGLPAVGEFNIINSIALAADARNSGVVYTTLTTGPIYKTTNGGRTWSELPPGSPSNIHLLVSDPVQAGTLYATTLRDDILASSLFKSTNGGASWVQIGQGLPPDTFLGSLVIDPRSPSTLFGRVIDRGVFKSTDGGRTWRPVSRGLPSTGFADLVLEAGRQPVLYAVTIQGLFRSFNQGKTWSPAGPLPGFVVSLEVVSGLLLATTDSGIYRSVDRGDSWTSSNRGLKASIVTTLAIDPQSHRLFAGENNSLLWTSDNGANWSTVRVPPPPQGGISTFSGVLAIAPGNPSTFYAGFARGVFRSTDGGRRWTATAFDCSPPRSLAIDPVTPATLYVGVFRNDDCPSTWENLCATFKSSDAGRSWACIEEGLLQIGTPVLAIDPFAPSHVYGLVQDKAIYRSTNGGGLWAEWSELPDATGRLVFDPVTPGLIYAGQHGRIARSEDNGQTWEVLGEGLPDTPVTTLLIQKNNPEILYAATLFRGVFKSADAGLTWTPLGPGLQELAVEEIVIDSADPNVLYAATRGGGVMKITQR